MAQAYGAKMTAPGLCIAANTGSMLPVLKGGEFFAVQVADFAKVQVGQVIVYYWPSRQINVVHRIVAIKDTPRGRAVFCKGDSNPLRDPISVTDAEFVGVAVLPPVR